MWLCQMEQIPGAICHHQWCHPNFSQTNWHRCTCWGAPFWALRTFSLAQLDALLSFELGQQKLFFHPGLDLKFFKKLLEKNLQKLDIYFKNFGTLLPQLFWWSRIFFGIRSWRRIIFKFFEITSTIYSNSERSEQFLVTEYFFNLFLEISQIW